MEETQETVGSIHVQRRLAHPPEDVWDALTDPDQVVQWMRVPRAAIDGRPGGHVEIDTHLPITGRVLAWKPPHLFEHEVKIAPSKATPTGEDAVLRYELRRDGDGCLLTMTLSRLTAASVRTFSKGFPAGLDRLERHLASRHPR